MPNNGPFNIAVILGSLRSESFSSRVAKAFESVAPPTFKFKRVETGELPLYNQDLDGDKAPAAYGPFRSAIAEADAILFVTSEYNRSIPGSLKNAIDIASRPFGKSAIVGKPAAVISQSPGAIGGFGANHAVRQSLVCLDMPVLQQPEAYLGHIAEAFDDQGALKNDNVRELLRKVAVAFQALIVRSR